MSAEPSDDGEGPRRPLVPRGNPLRLGGAALAFVTLGLLVLLMAKTGTWRFGVPIGVALAALATCGLLDALGTFDDRDAGRLAKVLRLADLAPPLACLALSFVIGFAAVTFAVSGRTGIAMNAIAITGAALSSLFFLGKLLERAGVLRGDPDGTPRPLWRRHGGWLLAIAIAIDLPMLGSHGLVDPWETHYGEVAREIVARDDWISLWWAQDGWFWSKPVLDFWLQALSMSTFGVRTGAGAMLSAAGDATTPWPEWAVRLPIAAMSILAVYLFYKAIAGSHSRRAGFFAGLVLATMPQWFLVTHQTMTDMPFVASMVAALSLFAIGIQQDPDREVRLFELRLPFEVTLRIGAHHLLLGAITITILPQIAMLLAQNIWFGDRWPPFKLVADTFSSGSPGNCGLLPGNDKCSPFSATWPRFQPALQAVLWVQALAFVLALSWGERRARRLAFLAAWWFVALATLAKGAPGLAIPVACIGLFAIVDRRAKELLEMEIPAGIATVIGVVLPWFVAMVVRHGMPFIDRLLFHDMIERALGHVHDTNQGDDVGFGYYVWQLGYATFPWVGIVPFALLRWRRSASAELATEATEAMEAVRNRSSMATLLALWFFVAFALFSLVETKFHHYILPAVPALAGLVGIACDGALRSRPALDAAGRLRAAQLGAASLLGVPLVLFVVRDVVYDRAGGAGQARFIHLFSYNYSRTWPDAVDLRMPILAFGIAAAIATGLAWGRRARFGVAALSTIAVLFSAWMLDVYFVAASPHWGQRELVLRYLASQKTDPGPLVAYQLNWKGENFYTGNHIAAFPSSGRPFREWIQSERRKGKKTFYVLTAPDRTGTLAAEMGLPGKTLPGGERRYEGLEGLTSPAENNKFVLVRIRSPKVTVVPATDG